MNPEIMAGLSEKDKAAMGITSSEKPEVLRSVNDVGVEEESTYEKDFEKLKEELLLTAEDLKKSCLFAAGKISENAISTEQWQRGNRGIDSFIRFAQKYNLNSGLMGIMMRQKEALVKSLGSIDWTVLGGKKPHEFLLEEVLMRKSNETSKEPKPGTESF